MIAPTRLKILSAGSGGTGKSCLIKRFFNNFNFLFSLILIYNNLFIRFCEERFVSKYIATIGVDYGVKPCTINGMDVRVNFWDLSGHEEFFEIRNEFFKDTQGILLVYDASSRESFDDLDKWLAEATKYGANPKGIQFFTTTTSNTTTYNKIKYFFYNFIEIPTVLCCNKVDKKRLISEDEGKQYANARGLTYFETSAATGNNVNEMFDFLFQSVLYRIKQ